MSARFSLADARAPLAAAGAAAIGALSPTPLLGVPATLVLVWMCGSSVVLLVISEPLLDPLVYRVMSAITGLAVFVATALAVFAAGVALTRTAVAVAVGSVAAGLTIASIRARAARRSAQHRGDPLDWLYWALTSLLLVGAMGFGLAVQSPQPDKWTLLSADAGIVRSGVVSVVPGGYAELPWILDVHGYRPASRTTEVTVQMGGEGVKTTTTSTFRRTEHGARVTGRTVVKAPPTPGLYRARITVTTTDSVGRAVVRTINPIVEVVRG